jgi:hypothetical protein
LALSLSGCIVALLLAGVIVRSPLELNQRDEWRGGKVHAADPGLYSLISSLRPKKVSRANTPITVLPLVQQEGD